MRTLTHKRIFSAVLATGLAASAMVALAATSDAAVKFKADANTSAGALLTITGSDLLDDATGAPIYDPLAIQYYSSACPAHPAAAAATNTGYASAAAIAATPVSDTKLTVSTFGFTPTLVAGKAKYNVCVYDNVSTSTGVLVGSTTTTFYAPPATVAQVGSPAVSVATLSALSKLLVGTTPVDATGSNLTGPSLGGTKISVKGVDFTAKTYITVGDVKLVGAKTTLAKVSTDPDVITGAVPAGVGTQPIKIVGEFGTYPVGVTGVTYATVSAGPVSWVYKPAVSVSPAGSDGAAGRVVTVKGTGFSATTFSNTFSALPSSGNTATVIAFVRGGTNLDTTTIANNAYFQGSSAAFANPTYIKYCDSITKVSDTELTCALPTGGLDDGAYSVVILKFSSTTMTSASLISRGATYVAADF